MEKKYMDIENIEKILSLIEKKGFGEVEIEQGDLRIKVKKSSINSPHTLERPPVHEPQTNSKTILEENDNQIIIRSPLVGTFYRSPSPGASNFVALEDSVKKGQILCIVEAMKLMNEVESEIDGKVISIFVENAQPVEYGEPLFLIEKNSSQ